MHRLIISAATILGLALMFSPVLVHTMTKDAVEFTVEKAERITDGQNNSKYLIFTDGETFENTDSLLAWKFNSSDVYGDMDVGDTCAATVVGFRVPFLSMYRNVLDVSCTSGAS